jgi:WD40 repeat protein
MLRFLLCCLLVIGVSGESSSWAEPFLDILPDKAHYVYALDRKQDRVLFGGLAYTLLEKNSPPDDPDARTLYERELNSTVTRKIITFPDLLIAAYSASPDGHHVAIRSTVYDRTDTKLLHLVDRGGHEIARIPYVWDIAWSPDGTQLAYVEGPKVVGYEDPRPSAVWIYDLRSRASKKVYDGGRYIAWAEFDRALYILDYLDLLPRVWRLDPVSQNPKLTSHRSVYFSPTGMYYYHSGINEGPFEVYDGQTNTPQFAPSLLRTRFPSGTEPIGWVDSGGNQLLFLTWSHPVTGKLDERPHTMLFDLDRGAIMEVDTERVIGTKAGTYITYRQKKFHRERPGEVRHAPPAPR